MKVCGPWRTSRGIRNGPATVNPNCASPYDGTGVLEPVNEKGRAFQAEQPKIAPALAVYSECGLGRPLPKERGCANGVAAPLLTLPLMTDPSKTSGGGSVAATEVSAG